jgi:hypothetical protein
MFDCQYFILGTVFTKLLQDKILWMGWGRPLWTVEYLLLKIVKIQIYLRKSSFFSRAIDFFLKFKPKKHYQINDEK